MDNQALKEKASALTNRAREIRAEAIYADHPQYGMDMAKASNLESEARAIERQITEG